MLVHVLLVDLQDVVVDIHDSERDGNPVRPERLELEGGHRAKGVLDQVESASGTLRLVLACTAYTSEENYSGLSSPPCSLVVDPRCRWRRSRRVFPGDGKNCMICLEILSFECV